MPHVADLDAPVGEVLAAAAGALGAEPEGSQVAGLVRFTSGDPLPVTATATATVGRSGTCLVLDADPVPAVPYFGWFVRPVLGGASRRALRHARAAIDARLRGEPALAPPRRPGLAPPTRFGDDQAALLATVCAIAAVTTFGAALLSQNVDYVADSFGAGDAELGVSLAVSRAGVLIALVLSAMADRRGRRRLMLASFAGVCLASLVAAASPNLVVFTVGQVLMRGFVNSALALAGVAVIEEAPEGARAYSLALLGLAGGFGYAFAVVLLPVSDLAPDAWRLPFALSALSVVALRGYARNLTETRRYASLAARGARRGRLGEVVDEAYGGRFGLLVAASFLLAIFSAPSSQLTNRYLAETPGFSNGFDITVFRAVTQGLPGVIGVIIGGRLAETRGRRPVAAIALFAGTAAQMLFFATEGPMLWVASAATIVLVAAAGPALGAFSGELFPTEVRGTANGFLLVAGVLGSAVGLLAVGQLSASWGLGPALVVLGVPSLLTCAVIVPLLPEPASRPLDEVSPSEV